MYHHFHFMYIFFNFFIIYIFDIFLDFVGVNRAVRKGYYAEFARLAGGTTEEFTAEKLRKAILKVL